MTKAACIARNIRLYRERLGCSQEELSQMAGFDISGIEKYTAWQIARLAEVLVCDMSDLLSDVEPKFAEVYWCSGGRFS